MEKLKSWYASLSRNGKAFLWVSAALASIMVASAAATPTPQTQQAPASNVKTTPLVEKKTVTETAPISYTMTTINDPNLESGKTALRTAGVNGTKTFTYEVTYTDGMQTDKKLTKEEVSIAPVNQVTAIGTKLDQAPAVQSRSACNSNYSGCVPTASDVDCAGGGGNGPAYLSETVTVLGSDVYGLDRDGDGLACE